MIAEIVGKIMGSLDDLFTSDEERGEIQNKLLSILTEYDKSSNEVNKIEAAGNLLQRTWRPLLALVCVCTFTYVNLVQPIFNLPKVEATNVTEMLYYLLGYSGLRSFEKIKGVVK